MNKSWYEIVIENWSQIAVLLGIISFIIKTIIDYRFKKREILFTRLQDNKIVEVKGFFKSYLKLELSLKAYHYQTLFGEHKKEIFSKQKEEIRVRFIDFDYHSLIVKLFLNTNEIETIDELNKTLESISNTIDSWHAFQDANSVSQEDDDKLDEILKVILPKRLPELVNQIETKFRKQLQLK